MTDGSVTEAMKARSTYRVLLSPRSYPFWITAVLLLAGPLLAGTNLFFALILAGIWAPAVLGLVLLVGWSGQISLGQGALAAVGAYGAGYFSVKLGLGALLSITLALLLVAGIAVLTSPILRVRGYYFSMVTLAMAIVVYQLAVLLEPVTGGSLGLIGIPSLQVFGLEIRTDSAFYTLSWAIVIIALLLVTVLISGRFGRALRTIGEDETLASSIGIPVARYKAYAWIISALLAGLSGTIYAYYNQFLGPAQFSVSRSIQLVAAVMLTSARSLTGGIVGTIVIFAGTEVLGIPSNFALLATALILIGAAIIPNLKRERAARLWRGVTARLPTSSRARPAEPGISLLDSPSVDVTEGGFVGRVELGEQWRENDHPILKIENLEKRFGGRIVLKGTSLEVLAGSIQGLIGPNGAGKSTILNCLVGGDVVNAGTFILYDDDITGVAPDVLARRGLVRTFQHPRLLPDLNVIENVTLGAFSRTSYGLPSLYLRPIAVAREEARLVQAAHNALGLLDIDELSHLRADQLTVGQRRLVATAQAVAAAPRVLCLDEPSAGLNPRETLTLANCLRRIRDMGVTIVLVEHDMELVMKLCDRVAVLFEGRIMVNDTPAQVTARRDVADAYLGVPQ